MTVDLNELLDDVHRGRRTVVAIVVVTAAMLLGTLVGPLMGGVAASGLAPLAGIGISDRLLTSAVFLGSLVFSVPISAFLLGASAVWHLRVRRALQAQGVDRPAVGILEPARLAAIPLLLGVSIAALAAPVALFLPGPEPGSLFGTLAGLALLSTVVLGPLVGLWLGLGRGLDRRGTERFEAGDLTLDDVPDDGRTFPLIQRTARGVIRAELLRREGRLDEADAVLRAHSSRSGVGPQETLLAWARVHRDAGRVAQAEQALAAAARLVPIDMSALRLLAELRREAGHPDDAARIEDEVAALQAGNLGLVLGRAQRAQA